MKIKIGADELILWLRKNDHASKTTTTKLGLDILYLINELGGCIIETERDSPCYWDTNKTSKNIKEDKLPMTASQYNIDSSMIGKLYETISGW